MRCLFSAGENLSDCSSHVSDQRRNGVVGRDLALSVLHVARFTAISYFTKDERTNTDTLMPAVQTAQTAQAVCTYTADQLLFHVLHCLSIFFCEDMP